MEKIGLILDAQKLGDIKEIAISAEDAGFHSVWATELYRTSFQQLAAVVDSTSAIKLGTAVALAFVRTPLNTALTTLDLDEASEGRLILGLGSGAKRTNELWHGIPHGKPVKRITECIELIRLIIERSHMNDTLSYEGEYYDVTLKGYRRAFPPLRPSVPIYLAGVGSGMTRAAGRVADGYIGHVVCTLGYLREVVVPSLKAGLGDSGKDRSAFTAASIITCAPSHDTKRAREAARKTIAFYATVRTYEPPFKMHGFERECALIREAFFGGDVEGMASLVSDDMVRAFAVVGTPDECRKRIGDYREFLDLPILSAPHYFLDFEEVRDYQRAILETFGG